MVADGVGVGIQVRSGSGVGFQALPGVSVAPLMVGGATIGNKGRVAEFVYFGIGNPTQ